MGQARAATKGRATPSQPPAIGRAKISTPEKRKRRPSEWRTYAPSFDEPPEEDPVQPPVANRPPREIRVRGRGPGGRSYLPVVTAILALTAAFGGAMAIGVKSMGPLADLLPRTLKIFGSGGSGSGDSDGSGDAKQAASPKRLLISSIHVDSEVEEVGLDLDGSIATPKRNPARDTGWYAPGPAPGEAGTAIIVGHVDTTTEPAVFARLRDLQPGSMVEVLRRDGRTAAFRVESVEYFPKKAFPADRIFAERERPRLALVTCGGSWAGGRYTDNVIVFAAVV